MYRILIVEDERIIAEDIKCSLIQFGYQIADLASSAEEAIDKSDKHRPDLVLMDICLQGDQNGVYAAKEIIMHFKIPVIFITANADQISWDNFHEVEHSGYLIKPFFSEDLRQKVEFALETRDPALVI
ncbi:MAG: response regulator [Candidatus Cloacimonetes bacterium]|nr:response regulator [Candidatus Cloacimonadota bacterium]